MIQRFQEKTGPRKNAFAFLIGLVTALSSAGCDSGTMEKKVSIVRFPHALVNIELADTEETRERGLMFRTSLATNSGMLFIFEEPLVPAFYMKNTTLPLDIVFISASNRVVTIKQMTPFDEKTLHRPEAPVKFALEVNAGWAARHDVKKGDPVVFLKTGKK